MIEELYEKLGKEILGYCCALDGGDPELAGDLVQETSSCSKGWTTGSGAPGFTKPPGTYFLTRCGAPQRSKRK